MDKQKLIRDCLEKERKELLEAIKKITSSRDESPIPTESRSDTSRIQADKMLGELNLKLKELERLLDDLPIKSQDNLMLIDLWSYVEISNKNSEIKLILVAEGYGGREFKGVRLVSNLTPLGQSLLGKTYKDFIILNKNVFQINFVR